MANIPSFYQNQNIQFPDMETVPQSQKSTPKYNFQVCQSIIDKYVNNRTEIGSKDTDYFETLRSYAEGRQDTAKYNPVFGEEPLRSGTQQTSGTLDALYESNTHASQKKGWYNVNMDDIVSPLPNVISQITGKLIDADFDIKANNIDIDSGAEEEWLMHKKHIQSTFGDDINVLKATAGIPIQSDMKYDFAELERIKIDGGFKAPYVMEQEKILRHTEDISLWDRKQKTKHEKDLLTLGYAFSYSDYDCETNKVKWYYTRPEDTIMQYSDENDFDDSEYGGVFSYVTISHIRSMQNYIRKSDGSKITEKDLSSLAKSYRGYRGNDRPSDSDWVKEWISSGHYNSYKYDSFKVCVAKTWWVDVEKEKKLQYTNKSGSKRFYEYDDSVKKLGNREKVKNVRTRTLYGCKWILGTDWVYDFGKLKNQPNNGGNKPLLPLRGVKLKELPIVRRLVPVVDQYFIAWLKLQNEIAKAAVAGYAIDVSKLANITDGTGKKYDMLDLVKMHRETGILFYKSNMNGYQTGGTPVPITALPSNLAENIAAYVMQLDQAMKMIEQLTGISPLALGASPTPDQAVGTSQLSINAFIDSLKIIVDGIKDLKEDLAHVSASMIGHALKKDKRAQEEYAKVIGSEGVHLLQMARNSNVQYGISLKARPTTEDWNVLIDIAKASLEKRNQGIGCINESQFFEIFNAKNTGQNLTEMFYKMKYWIKEDEKRIQEEKERMLQLQAQGQQNVVVTQQEQQRKTQQEGFMMKIREIEAEMMSKLKQRETDSYYTIREIGREYEEKLKLQRADNKAA
jgi:hypothetical protein